MLPTKDNNYSSPRIDNPSYVDLAEDGCFVFLDGFFIIDEIRYIEQGKNGRPRLTPYARDHLDEYRIRLYLETMGKSSKFRHQIRKDTDLPQVNIVEGRKGKSPTRIKKFKDAILEEWAFNEQRGTTFCDEVTAHIRRKGCNRAAFSRLTGLSEQTYDRIVRHKVEHPCLDTVMMICVGLDLGFAYGEVLFNKAGYRLGGTKAQHAYRKILLSFEGISIHECNEILEEIGLPKLNSKYQS